MVPVLEPYSTAIPRDCVFRRRQKKVRSHTRRFRLPEMDTILSFQIYILHVRQCLANQTRRMFLQSLGHIENFNTALSIPELERFAWHTSTHSGFTALMHVVYELRSSSWNAPERSRALSALQTVKTLKRSSNSKNWIIIRRIIDRILANNALSEFDGTGMPASSPLNIQDEHIVDHSISLHASQMAMTQQTSGMGYASMAPVSPVAQQVPQYSDSYAHRFTSADPFQHIQPFNNDVPENINFSSLEYDWVGLKA
jgi:hypothetical protein